MQTNMTIPLWSLLAMVVWTMTLVISVTFYRSGQVFLGKNKANDFPAALPHGPELYRRLMRAHMNCVENLPLFATVVIVAHVVNAQNPTLDLLSIVYVLARMAQTVVHLVSEDELAVRVRFFFFAIQLSVVITFLGMIPVLD